MSLAFFTSINNNYLDKAIILAESIKRFHPQAPVFCVLSDERRADLDYSAFDEVLFIEDLNVPVDNLQGWIFSHDVVELCTAVKPFAFKTLLARDVAFERIVYLDPDIVVYAPLDELQDMLMRHDIVVTPHVTVPATSQESFLDGELMGSMRHGVFNLGFLAVARREEGLAFLDWWAERCRDYCYAEVPKGIFTDQRWIDLAPCFFDSLLVLRDPSYNVATWNLYARDLARREDGTLVVNGHYPLKFFHFSGFDIGTHEHMLDRYAKAAETVREITRWYIAEQTKKRGKPKTTVLGHYDAFTDGTRIEKDWRIAYRRDAALLAKYPDPFRQGTVLAPVLRQAVQRGRRAGEGWRLRLKSDIERFLRDHPRLLRLVRKNMPDSLVDRFRQM